MKRRRPSNENEDDEDLIGNRLERVRKRRNLNEIRTDCPYLYTINRQVLDFDIEKFCSVSLSPLNVYACLVCGKYFQGRGHKSHAHTHSLESGHRVYINVCTERVYCLPDGYEINDPSLDDIRCDLNPRFSCDEVSQLDDNRIWSRALDGLNYLPGMVGLRSGDAINAIIQSLMRVTPLRNFFLVPENYTHCKSVLVQRFGELTRKIWHARNFKGRVSPHEFLQEVMKASKKRLCIRAEADPVEFMSWLLNTLHTDLKSAESKSSIIHECFQGKLEYEENEHVIEWIWVHETGTKPFFMLGLDLPSPPLFKDMNEENLIPQVSLFEIMRKFDGKSVTEVARPRTARMTYRVTRLPQYLILHIRRFKKNRFFVEKNTTLVNFPVKNLELKDCIPLPTPPKEEEKKLRSEYNLIANIIHEGKPGEGSYKVDVQCKSTGLWYEMQKDLSVHEIHPLTIALTETVVLIYEQKSD